LIACEYAGGSYTPLAQYRSMVGMRGSFDVGVE